MALKDRDYMQRRGRDDPYHNQLELGPPGSTRIVATGIGERDGRARHGAVIRRPLRSVALAIVITASLGYAVPHVSSWTSPSAPTSRVIHIDWHEGLTTPAAAPAVWSIDTPNGQRLQVTVQAGETPLDLLTNALAAQGWRATYP